MIKLYIWDLTYISQSFDKFCRLVPNVQVMDDFLKFSAMFFCSKKKKKIVYIKG